MTLAPCPECGVHISRDSTKCPECGHVPSLGWQKWAVTLGCVLPVALVAGFLVVSVLWGLIS